MATNTSRLSLTKPSSSENAEVSVLNSNFDTIDQNAGARICTSTTRPSQPFIGQIIFETDVAALRWWDGTNWRTLTPFSVRGNSQGYTAVLNTYTALGVMNGLSTGTLYGGAFNYYRISGQESGIRATMPGYYQLTAWVRPNAKVTVQYLRFQKNASPIQSVVGGGDVIMSLYGNATEWLDANDTLSASYYVDNPSSVDIRANEYTGMMLTFLGG